MNLLVHKAESAYSARSIGDRRICAGARVTYVTLAMLIVVALTGGCGKMLDKIPRPRVGPIHGGHAAQKAKLASEADNKTNAPRDYNQAKRVGTTMKIELVRGDITERPFDAIVNAANTWLIPGGGVDGAIHRAGGPSILEACKRVITEKYPGGLTRGQAVATTAGKLPAKWVIHAVGPIFSKTVDRSEQLIAAYRSSLRVADEVGAKTIAFPAISTGPYAYPPDEAARLAVEALRYAKTDVDYAEFVLLDITLFEAFMNAMFDDDSLRCALAFETDV